MDVIPVIDVRHGLAVAAVRGRRSEYRPLVTPLASGSDPAAVARGYAALFAFPVLYVADLDGIEGRGRDAGLPARLATALPTARLWIDDGTRARDAQKWMAQTASAMLVIGSESLATADDVVALRTLHGKLLDLGTVEVKEEELPGLIAGKSPQIVREASLLQFADGLHQALAGESVVVNHALQQLPAFPSRDHVQDRVGRALGVEPGPGKAERRPRAGPEPEQVTVEGHCRVQVVREDGEMVHG